MFRAYSFKHHAIKLSVLVLLACCVYADVYAQTTDFDITKQLRERGLQIPDGVRGSTQDFNILGLTPNGEDPIVFLRTRAGTNDVVRLNPQFARCLASLMQATEQKTGKRSMITNQPIGAYRHPSHQARLVGTGASKVGPGWSFHGCGTAADVTDQSNSMHAPFVYTMRALAPQFNISTIGTWDAWHFEGRVPRPCNGGPSRAFNMNAQCSANFKINEEAFNQALAQGGIGTSSPTSPWLGSQQNGLGSFIPHNNPTSSSPTGQSNGTGPGGATGAGTGQQNQQQPYTPPTYGQQGQKNPYTYNPLGSQATGTGSIPPVLTANTDIYKDESRSTKKSGTSKIELIAKPKLALPGTEIKIGWRTSNVTSCTLSGPQITSEKKSGIATFTIEESGVYTLTCITTEESKKISATVSVTLASE